MRKVIEDGILYGVRDFDVKVIGFAKNQEREQVVIAGYINSKPVAEIAKNSFRTTCIEQIFLPTTIRTINQEAFADCKNLKTVECYIPDVPIGANKPTYDWLHVYDAAFANCTSLETVTFSKPIMFAATGAFAGCKNLSKMNAKVGKVQKFAFENCHKLTELHFNNKWGHISTKSIECSGIKHLIFDDTAEMTQAICRYIRTKDILISCPPHSELVNLAYQGVRVQTI